MITSKHANEIITVNFSDRMGVAELSCLTSYNITISGLESPVYYFNRLKVPKEDEGKGFGKQLMIEVCKIADEEGITILNELNPYGNRDMERLKEFFSASGFEDFRTENTMVRRPRKEKS